VKDKKATDKNEGPKEVKVGKPEPAVKDEKNEKPDGAAKEDKTEKKVDSKKEEKPEAPAALAEVSSSSKSPI